MASVSFQFVGEAGRFQVCDSQGNEVVVEAGKNFSTADPAVIRELDASGFVERVKSAKKED